MVCWYKKIMDYENGKSWLDVRLLLIGKRNNIMLGRYYCIHSDECMIPLFSSDMTAKCRTKSRSDCYDHLWHSVWRFPFVTIDFTWSHSATMWKTLRVVVTSKTVGDMLWQSMMLHNQKIQVSSCVVFNYCQHDIRISPESLGVCTDDESM